MSARFASFLMLLFLDLPAAFDTVNHQVFCHNYNIVLELKDLLFQDLSLIFGDPRSLCASTTQVFLVVTWCCESLMVPLLDRFCTCCTLLHMYANNSQLYMSFKSSITSDIECFLSTLKSCVCAIEKWVLQNNL